MNYSEAVKEADEQLKEFFRQTADIYLWHGTLDYETERPMDYDLIKKAEGYRIKPSAYDGVSIKEVLT